MNGSMRRGAVTGALLLATALAACTVGDLRCVLQGERSHPSDAELRERFGAHRAELETLRRMLDEDRAVQSIRVESGVDDPGAEALPAARRAEYRRLLDALDAQDLSTDPARTSIVICLSNRGFVTHGSSKGYLYAPRLEGWPVVPELDTLAARGKGAGVVLLQDGWYLYFLGD